MIQCVCFNITIKNRDHDFKWVVYMCACLVYLGTCSGQKTNSSTIPQASFSFFFFQAVSHWPEKSPCSLGWPVSKPQMGTRMPIFKIGPSCIWGKYFTDWPNFQAFFSLFFFFFWPTLGLIQGPTSSSWKRGLLPVSQACSLSLHWRLEGDKTGIWCR